MINGTLPNFTNMTLDQIVATGITQTVPDQPLFLGLLMLMMFFLILAFGGSRLDGKIAVLIPAAILAAALMGQAMLGFIALIGGFLIYMALMKLINK